MALAGSGGQWRLQEDLGAGAGPSGDCCSLSLPVGAAATSSGPSLRASLCGRFGFKAPARTWCPLPNTVPCAWQSRRWCHFHPSGEDSQA